MDSRERVADLLQGILVEVDVMASRLERVRADIAATRVALETIDATPTRYRPEDPIGEEHYTRERAAEYLGVSLRTVDRRIADGTLISVKIGDAVRIPRNQMALLRLRGEEG